jgi:hypothetical protein
MKRNLFYNCCALVGAEQVTRDNIAWLCKYGAAFNGRVIIHIKTGPGLEQARVIRPLFKLLEPHEIQEWPNDPAIGETAGFLIGLWKLRSKSANEATFYAHTKGVARYNLVPENRVQSIRQWYRRMYVECLADPAKVDAVLAAHATCGCFFNKRPLKHYSGAFYWMRHDRLFADHRWAMSLANCSELDLFTHRPSPHERKRFFVEMFLDALFDAPDFYNLHSEPNPNHNKYVQPYKLYVCRKCGQFMAPGWGRVKCPKCRNEKVTFTAWPELGY